MATLLTTILDDCQKYCNRARSLLTFVSSEKFATAIKHVTQEDETELKRLIASRDLANLRILIDKLMQKEYAELSVRMLRKIAQEKGILGYTYMSKSTLLSELYSCEHPKKS